MAKMSMKNRELKRQLTVAKYAKKRAELKAIIVDLNASPEARWEATVALQKQPRDASAARMRNRCLLSRPPAGYASHRSGWSLNLNQAPFGA
ncbi:30S ribosomal protein S14 [Pseudomonas syringae pv. syringae]|nr:30S ribosomal protein S14 [Pseudomonas syringae pv. syringae]